MRTLVCGRDGVRTLAPGRDAIGTHASGQQQVGLMLGAGPVAMRLGDRTLRGCPLL